MRRGLKKALALVGALVLTFSMSASVFAADKADIVLDGGEEGVSKMIGTFSGPQSRGEVTDAYKYLGYVSFLDLADKDYKYLQITYTGNITQFRIQFVHDAAKESEDIDPVKYWFNSEVVADSENKPLVTKGGSAIPLEGNKTTVVIDLEKSGIDMKYFNSGLHMHCDEMKKNGEFTISDARLIANEEAAEKVEKENGSKNNSVSKTKPAKADTNTNTNTSTGNGSQTSTNTSGAPATGSATYPIALGFGGIAVACVAFIASRKFKEEN